MGKKSVSAIASELKMSQSAISHQLKTLRQADIVKSKRKGKEVFYGLTDFHVKVIMEQVFSHTSHVSNEQ
jgi:DNA-binding transcriptional ArsR family regulator